MGGKERKPIGDLQIGSRIVHPYPPTPSVVEVFLSRIRHPDGRLNRKHPDIKSIMNRAERKRLDVLMLLRGHGIELATGRLIADHEKLIKLGVGVTLGAAVIAGTIGLVLRKHKRIK